MPSRALLPDTPRESIKRHHRIGRIWKICLVLAILTTSKAWAQAPQFSLKFEAPHAPDRIIVRYRTISTSGNGTNAATVIAASRSAVHQALSATGHALLTVDGRTELIRLPASVSVGTAILQLRNRTDVEYAEPDFEVSIETEPNDPRYTDGSLWGLNNTGGVRWDGFDLANADINAPEGWSLRHDASQVVVAVIDTGIRRTHQDLAANMWENLGEIAGNGIDDDGNGYIDDRYGLNAITYTGPGSSAGDPMDDNGHGTHVSGTIGAVGNNNIGVTGVAWSVRLMACKFLSSGGWGYTSDAIECVDYARARGAHVINASWGGGGYSRALRDAIGQAYESGIVFVTAAGNNATDNDEIDVYPANLGLDNIVAVAALASQGNLAGFSNRGQHTVPLAAPGDMILSSHYASDTAYEYYSGTSMASPHVAGVMAMLRAHFPGEPVNRLINRLYRSVRALPDLAGKVRTGGVVDLAAALMSTNPAPAHDDRSRALRIFGSGDGANFEIFGTNDAASHEAGEFFHGGNLGGASVWYKYVARRSGTAEFTVASTGTFQPVLGVYAAWLDDALVPMASAVASQNSITLTVSLQAGRSYFFAVDGIGGESGRFIISAQQRPGNDDFAEAQALSGISGLITQYADGATAELGEPPPSDYYEGGSSIWYTWTAPESGVYTFRTLANNPSSEPRIAFYTGASLANLTRAFHLDIEYSGYFYAGGETIAGLTTSTISATAGNVYSIQVDGLTWTPGGLGNLRLYWDPTPQNDSFANKLTLSGAVGTTTGDTKGATAGYWPRATYGNGTRDVWFRWVAPANGMVTFGTLTGTDWDTTLEVFSGSEESNLRLLASNDDAFFGLQSSLSCYVHAGAEYTVRLNGFSLGLFPSLSTPSGAYQLNWSFDAVDLAVDSNMSDFNADGKSDVVWRNPFTGQMVVMLMNGTIKQSETSLTLGSDYMLGATADFNGDGKADMLLQNTVTGERGIYLMNGMTLTSWIPLGYFSTDYDIVAAADFNGDGKPDTLWQNTVTGERGIYLMNGTSLSSWVPLGNFGTNYDIAAAADFDGDGKPDTLWQNTTTGERGIYLMNGTAFTSWVPLGYFSTDYRIVGTSDFNSDGKPDTLWQNTVTGERGIYLMNGTTFTSWVGLGYFTPPVTTMLTNDFNGDGKADTLWQNTVTGERGIYLMNGTTRGTWAPLGNFAASYNIAAIADFNGDSKPDTFWQNKTTGERGIYLMNGTTFTSWVPQGYVAIAYDVVGAADFNGDGKPDTLWQNTTTGERGIYLMNGTTRGAWVPLGSFSPNYRIAVIADFNVDGKPDTLWQNTVTGECGIYLMNGTTFSSWVPLGYISTNYVIVAAADYNNDGKTDTIWQNIVTGECGIYLMNGTAFSSWVPLGYFNTQYRIAQ